MSIYDVTNHALLSGAAKMLSPDELDAQSTLAEALLGLDDVGAFTDDPERARAQMAVALQVSFQVEKGVDGAVATSRTEGSRAISYRDTLTHPMASDIVSSLLSTGDAAATDFTPLLSLRGVGTPPTSEFLPPAT